MYHIFTYITGLSPNIATRPSAPVGSRNGRFVKGYDSRRQPKFATTDRVPMRSVTRVTGELAGCLSSDQLVLRPKAKQNTSSQVREFSNGDLDNLQMHLGTDRISGMRLVDVNHVSDAYNRAFEQHEKYLLTTRRQHHVPRLTWHKECLETLAVTVTLKCTHLRCQYMSDKNDLFRLVTASGKKGRRRAQVNVALSNFIVRTKTTPDDCLDFFSSIGMPVSRTADIALQRTINRSADTVLTLSNTLITENRNVVEEAARTLDPQRLAEKGRVAIDIKFDGRYPTRTIGRSYSSKSKMCDTVATEIITKKEMPMAYVVHSKYGARTKGALDAPGICS